MSIIEMTCWVVMVIAGAGGVVVSGVPIAKTESSYKLGVCASGGRLLWDAIVADGPIAPSPSDRLSATTEAVTRPVTEPFGRVDAYV